jgi:hypothetical protein
VLRAEVQQGEGGAEVSLLADNGVVVAAWTHDGADAPGAFDQPELLCSHDRAFATVVVDQMLTVVRLADGQITARGRGGRGTDASFPLDRRWTLEVAGELTVDGGHTGYHSGGTSFFWADPDGRPAPAQMQAEIARERAGFVAAANMSIRRRWVLHSEGQTVLVHESDVSPAQGGRVLLWPPVIGPSGVLLRHAIATDHGLDERVEPQRPWLVHADGTVQRLPFELGVSPLLAMPDGRWLLPGLDSVWRDDYDEPLGVLDATGKIEPLLVAGTPVPASRVLREAAPQLLSALQPIDPNRDVAWETQSARLNTFTEELMLAIEITRDDETSILIVAGLSLAGVVPARLIAQFESTPRCRIAVAP